jgi:hypothetical protein
MIYLGEFSSAREYEECMTNAQDIAIVLHSLHFLYSLHSTSITY